MLIVQCLGGSQTDANGQVIEDLMDERGLVCMNDGRGTRVNMAAGTESALDITLVSNSLAGISTWEIWVASTIGSDHYPVLCMVGERGEVSASKGVTKWVFGKADWDKFQRLSEETVNEIDMCGDIDEINKQVTSAIIKAAERAIPRSKNEKNRRLVPWWMEECRQAVRNRNRAFREVKRTHNIQSLIQYKRAQAVVKRTVRQAKRASWRNFCSQIGRTTPVGEVWGMIKRMGGDRREWDYPVITYEEDIAVSDKEKAEIVAKSFVKIHSSENLSEEGKKRRERTMSQHPGVLDRREGTGDVIDEPFTLAEMMRAIKRSQQTSPGKDQVSYIMLKHLGNGALLKLLWLYNRVWEEGRLPGVWKEAVVIPIRKPGKDPSKPSSYRPIALTSNMCKIMERMITERLAYQLEKKGLLANYQSGFRRGRNTMDSVIRLETEIRKA